MKIHSMTATFGKLEGQTLTLSPGLNILEAPNEWGKSTWCAFLLAMLYGVSTKDRVKTGHLPVKEQYAPWSGAPMSGRIDLHWQGRDITIERSSTARSPMSRFRAYETDTGLAVPELTADNCGEKLLGVEQSVYLRSGFLRLRDLPVTQDEALRRRLQALVTTGDDSGSGDKLESELRNLKNKIGYRGRGLLPQAQGELTRLEGELAQGAAVRRRLEALELSLNQACREEKDLTRHRRALDYAAAQGAQARIEKTRRELEAARDSLAHMEAAAGALPSREAIGEKLSRLEKLTWDQAALRDALHSLPPEPQYPQPAPPYDGEDPAAMVAEDTRLCRSLRDKKRWPLFLLAALAAAGGVVLALMELLPLGLGLLAGAVALGAVGLTRSRKLRGQLAALEEKYGSLEPDRWARELEACLAARREYHQALARWRHQETALEQRSVELKTRWDSLCGSQEPAELARIWHGALGQWDALDNARQRQEHLAEYLARLEETAPQAEPVPMDTLPYDRAQTLRRLEDVQLRRRDLEQELAHLQGRAASLESPEALEARLEALRSRCRELQEKETAVILAQNALSQARESLQRRFAPRIVAAAQDYMARLTGGRYDRLTWDQDFALFSGTREENTTRAAAYRSDGTADQLYLALRLAVAEALLPQPPLVLDDALVRFDDTRLLAALKLLEELGQERQILLFTCQGREKRLAEQK